MKNSLTDGQTDRQTDRRTDDRHRVMGIALADIVSWAKNKVMCTTSDGALYVYKISAFTLSRFVDIESTNFGRKKRVTHRKWNFR